MFGINATLTHDLGQDDRDGPGGVHVSTGLTIALYGNTRALYMLSEPIHVDRFTELKFDLDTAVRSESMQICFYEDETEIDRSVTSYPGTEFRCEKINLQDEITIKSLGRLFDNRTTTVNFIEFRQVNTRKRVGNSKLSNITFATDPTTIREIESKPCKDRDPHAIQDSDSSSANIVCSCEEGYVASNGGKTLNTLDSCVECLLCAFEGDFCVYDRDCIMGTCVDYICASANVSKTKMCFTRIA